MAWTPKRAARLGWLAGRGASLRSVLQDAEIGAVTARSLRQAATRWHIEFGRGARGRLRHHAANHGPQDAGRGNSPLAIPIPPGDQEILEQAAAARGLSVASFAADLLHVIASQRLIRAVMDDDR